MGISPDTWYKCRKTRGKRRTCHRKQKQELDAPRPTVRSAAAGTQSRAAAPSTAWRPTRTASPRALGIVRAKQGLSTSSMHPTRKRPHQGPSRNGSMLTAAPGTKAGRVPGHCPGPHGGAQLTPDGKSLNKKPKKTQKIFLYQINYTR